MNCVKKKQIALIQVIFHCYVHDRTIIFGFFLNVSLL